MEIEVSENTSLRERIKGVLEGIAFREEVKIELNAKDKAIREGKSPGPCKLFDNVDNRQILLPSNVDLILLNDLVNRRKEIGREGLRNTTYFLTAKYGAYLSAVTGIAYGISKLL